MQTLVIINHFAAKALRAWPVVRKQLASAGIAHEVYETTGAGDATRQTRIALRNGITTIAVIGGDGTLSEAAEGFFEFNHDVTALPETINLEAALAIIPAGTGDDFARGLYGARAPLQHWIDLFISHCQAADNSNARLVDVLYGRCDGYLNPFICLNASTMGIGGDTAARVAAQGKFVRGFSGEFRFVLAAVGALSRWRERRVRISLDDREFYDCSMNLAAVANALYAGGGMMFSPGARIDDGRLDVVTACGLSRAQVVKELSRIHTGGHVENPKVTIKQAAKVRIETFSARDAMRLEADGNVRGFTPVEFQVLPGALRFVA
jgi:YegS/Rv2252/BmrU family lipid kinase